MRIVICCIGNELQGDDAFGILVYRKLKDVVKEEAVILNCGTVPENYLGKIVDLKPDLVIFVDAVDFGGKPGEIIMADPEETMGEAMSTHNLPLKVLTNFIKKNTNAKVILIGCQPKDIGLFMEVSKEVREAVDKAFNYIIKLLS
nr:hydrogenase maturation peptidase HycI [Pyrococcus sp. NA2]